MVVLTIALLSPLLAYADEPFRIDTIQASPLGFVTADGQSKGLYFEIGNRVAEAAGLSFTNRVVPFARAITALENGDADMSMFFRREGNPRLVPLAKVYVLKNIVIGRKGTRFETFADLQGKEVAKMRRTDYGEAFEKDSAIAMVEINNYAQGIAMLMEDRVDAVVGPEIGLFFSARQSGYGRELFSAPLEVSRREVWVQVSAATVDEAKQAALKAAIELLLADGAIQQIIEKYTSQ